MRTWITVVLLGLAALPCSVRAQNPGGGYYWPPMYPPANAAPYPQANVPVYPQPYAPAYPQPYVPAYPQPSVPKYPYVPMNPQPYAQPARAPSYPAPYQYPGVVIETPQTNRRPPLPANTGTIEWTQATELPPAVTPPPIEVPAKGTKVAAPEKGIELPLAPKAAPEKGIDLPLAPKAPPLIETPAKATNVAAPEKGIDLPLPPKALPVIETPAKATNAAAPEKANSTLGTVTILPNPLVPAAPQDEAAKKPVSSALFPTGAKEAIQAPEAMSTAPTNLIEACETNKCCFVIFGDYLFWTVHGVDVPYAQAFDGVLPGLSAPRGSVSVVSPNFNSGFRVGGGVQDGNQGIYGTFTYFRTDRSSDAAAPDPFVLHNFLAFPNTVNSAVDSFNAHVDYRILLLMADIDYKCAIVNNDHMVLNWLVGVRYAHVEQALDATFQITGTTTVNSTVNFDGFGPRVGLDGKYYVCGGVYGYAQGIFDLLFGQFRANSIEQNVFTGLVGQTGITANRAVPILELELGLGWQSPGGSFRLQGGYYVGAWFNTITMTSLSNGITATNFTTNGNNFRDNMTFDGLVLRAEFRY